MGVTIDGTLGITTNGTLIPSNEELVTTDNSQTLTNKTYGSPVITGNVTINGTGNRITGDFSNATLASRVMFQTSTTNGNAMLAVLPNGTAAVSNVSAFNNSDPTNAAVAQIRANGSSSVDILSGITGTGTYLPMTFYTGGSERVRIDTSGNVGVGINSPISSFGRTLHLYNDANTGTVASNQYLLVQSANRNSVIELAGSAGAANFVNFSNTPGTAVAGVGSDIATQALLFRTGGVATPRMTIDSSGNVGIGTISPTSFGGTNLNINAADSSKYASTLWVSGTYIMETLVNQDSGVMSLGSRSNHPLSLVTNDTPRVIIDSTGKTTFNSTIKLQQALEKVTVTAGAPASTTNFDCLTQGVQYYTSAATTNWTLNIRGDGSNSLDSMMATGESITFTVLVTQTASAYYSTAHQIDGGAVTPKWSGGTAPTSGDSNAISIYSYTVIKTGAATFTLLASKSKYA